MLKHPQIGSYWRGHSNDSKVAKLKLFVDFVCEATGGPVMYQGRDMKTTHEGLNISEADWKDFVKLTAAALNQSGLPVREKDELFSFLTSFKSEMSIAEPPAAPTAKDARNANGLTPREMEVLQLLVQGEEFHTASGAHAKRLQTWERWAERVGLALGGMTVEEGKRRLEEALAELNEQSEGKGKLPWQ